MEPDWSRLKTISVTGDFLGICWDFVIMTKESHKGSDIGGGMAPEAVPIFVA